ncbi:adhesive plaque matrix protein-like [Neocloeon triangulifer]|uniref:adhesive plaque matrix protein-like n=1 Tax=Neocloeon triangulifer TaxID=2078957 RepID=UPI00286EE25C|nr:adhesive plaque matrix protein-like [Neocloeon triangulifer]
MTTIPTSLISQSTLSTTTSKQTTLTLPASSTPLIISTAASSTIAPTSPSTSSIPLTSVASSVTPTSPAPTSTPLVIPPTTSTLANTGSMFMEVTTGGGEPYLPLYQQPGQYGGQIPKPQVSYGMPWQMNTVSGSGLKEKPSYFQPYPTPEVAKPNLTSSSSYPSASYFGYGPQQPQYQSRPNYALQSSQNYVPEIKPSYGQAHEKPSYQPIEIKPYRPYYFVSGQYNIAPNEIKSPYAENSYKPQASNFYISPPKQEGQTASVGYLQVSPLQHTFVQSATISSPKEQKPQQNDFPTDAKPQYQYSWSSSGSQSQPYSYSPIRPLAQSSYGSNPAVDQSVWSNYGGQSWQEGPPAVSQGQSRPNYVQQDAPASSQDYTSYWPQPSNSYVQPQGPVYNQKPQQPSYSQTSLIYGYPQSGSQFQPPPSSNFQPSAGGQPESQKQPSADEAPSSQQVPPLLLDQQIGGNNQPTAPQQSPPSYNAISQCDQTIKLASDRNEVTELTVPAGKCNISIEAPKGRLALQLKGIMIACDEQQGITVFEAENTLSLTRLCGQVPETPLYLMESPKARLEVKSRGLKFTLTSFLW